MRIVITRLGKNEIKEVDYEDISYYNLLNQINKNKTRTISYNKTPKHIPIYNKDKNIKVRNNNSLQQRIQYTQLPILKKNYKNINNTINSPIKNRTSFISKMNGFSTSNQVFKTPKQSKHYLELNKNNQNNSEISNENSFLNTNSNKKENVFRSIKINSKKLNIPIVMLDKYTKESLDKNKNNNLYLFNNDESKINNTENTLGYEKNKMYKLRDILLPKNKRNIDDSFLEKKINSYGG